MRKVPSLNAIGEKACCGCEACSNICPVKAIEMREDATGFLFPVLIRDLCIDCGKCLSVCPVHKYSTDHKTYRSEVLVGYSKNEAIVEGSSSGGFFSIIAENALNKDASVVGVKWDMDYKSTRHVIISKHEDLETIKLSKYIQSNKNFIYKEIKERLINGELIYFVGCPCETAALFHYLPLDLHKNLYLIDLVCQGPTSQRAMREYIDYIEKKYNSSVKAINMRFAIGPWIPQYLKIIFHNNRIYINRLYDTYIGDAIRIMQRPCCYDCLFSGDGRYSDITLGDYHGAKKGDSFYHESGISIAVPHTEKGFEIIETIKRADVYFEYLEYEKITNLNPRIEAPWNPLVEYKKYVSTFKESGLIKATKNAISKKKRIVRLLPIQLRIRLEKIKKRINSR